MTDIVSETVDMTFDGGGSSANLLLNGEMAKVYAPREGDAFVVANADILADALREYAEKANEFIKKAQEAEMKKIITHEEMAKIAIRMLESLVLAMRSFEEELEKECEILGK